MTGATGGVLNDVYASYTDEDAYWPHHVEQHMVTFPDTTIAVTSGVTTSDLANGMKT